MAGRKLRPPVYQRIVSHPWIAPLKPSWQRSRHTSAPLRFFAREALRRRRGARYEVRRAPGVPLALRHMTPDIETFDQVFLQAALAEPPEVAALLDGLGRPPAVLDLGANVGLAAAWFAARWPGARITCVEPDPFNLEPLREAAARSGGRWRVVAAAAAAEPGTLRFHPGGFGVSRAVEGGEIEVEAVDFFALAAEVAPDLIKIDIEGGEWPLLTDPRLGELTARAVALEFHPHGCPGPSARDEAVARLQAAGYTVRSSRPVADAPPDEGSLWAWRS